MVVAHQMTTYYTYHVDNNHLYVNTNLNIAWVPFH